MAPDGHPALGIDLDVPSANSTVNPASSQVDRIGKATDWVFRVKDVRGLYEVLGHRGVHFIQTPTDQPWGTTQAILEGPDGNIFVVESRASGAGK